MLHDNVPNMAYSVTILGLLDLRTVLVACVVFLTLSWLIRRPRNLPPGPWGWPLIGSLPTLAMAPGDPHEIFQRMAQRYGPVFTLNILGQRLVLVHGYEAIREAFQHPSLSDRPELHLVTQMLNGSEGIAAASGEIWKEQRKLALNVFKNFGVGKSSFEDQIATEAEHMMNEMHKLEGKAFNPDKLFMTAVSDIIAVVVFGKRFEYDDPEFQRILASIHRNLELIGAGAAMQFLPITKYLGFLPSMQEMRKNIQLVVNFTKNIIDRHLKEFDSDDKRDFMDMYISEMKEREKQNTNTVLSVDNLISVINDLFVAGTETTATTLRWGLLYMILHPDVQERVQREIDAVVGRNRLPRMSHRSELPYTEAVLLELQRIGNIVPLGVPHRASENTTFQGYTIPKDTFIVANHWALHRDPKLFPEPEKFSPERFLNADGEAVKPEELIPFSTGRRVCLGEQLAKMELFIFFTYLLHQFTFKKPQGSPPINLKGHLGITLAPVPFEVCAIPR
ncbi:cytochrome P450 2J6-like [Acanthaster planci]|uniref:Cytochrome P450 2J6-like n=1 Tax=Acanthaster planci TaxID=133434 RepID=A0A8B7YCC1_ACAPL|nr:cytochrome P450 2J6-like [Acanthaster planci]